MIFLISLLAVTQQSLAQYGEACIDQIMNVPGICCPLSSCRPAQHDLRLRLMPTECSFDIFMPLVCCRAGCGDPAGTDAGVDTATTRPPEGRAGGGDGARISERMCAEYDKILTLTRTKREAFNYYEYGNEEYQHHPEPPMYPDDSFTSSYARDHHSSDDVIPCPSEPEFPTTKLVIPHTREPEISTGEAALPYPSQPEIITSEAVIPYHTEPKTNTGESATPYPSEPEIPTPEAAISLTSKTDLHTNAAVGPDLNEPAAPNINAAIPHIWKPDLSTDGAVFPSHREPELPTSEAAIGRTWEPELSTADRSIARTDTVPLPDEEVTTRTINTTSNVPPVVYAAIGGINAFQNEFPHMAALGWPLKDGGFVFNCGATLISERFVMTAGHCLNNGRDTSLANPEPTIVRLGDLNILENVPDGANPIDIPILRTFRHPNYSPPIKYFDIALLELQTAVTFSDHVYPACLWTKNTFDEHKSAIITGWGTITSGRLDKSAILQKVHVDILETSVCQPLLQTSWNRNWQGFSDHQLCAGVLKGGKDACQGDSGGPLQVIIPGYRKKYHVIGVTAFGRECGKPNQPGVYTRVSAFIDWIESVVWPTAAAAAAAAEAA